MVFAWYANQLPAVVRRLHLSRHRVLIDEKLAIGVVLLAQGPPRAWKMSLDAALLGIQEALKHGGGAQELLTAAAEKVRCRAQSLLDVDSIETHAIALSAKSDGQATIAIAGSCRVYLHRRGEHRRMNPESSGVGLAKCQALSVVSENLAPEDLVLLGPSHIFGVPGAALLARLLHNHQQGHVSGQQIVEEVLSGCKTQGTGGAAIALWVT